VGEIAVALLAARPKDEDPPYAQISIQYRDLAQLQKDNKDAEQGELKYYDYYLYGGQPFSSPTLNVTGYYSSRNTPASVSRETADLIIWMFGGSTMQNFETSDELSIANSVAKVCADRGVKVRVENFGNGSFQSSLEFVKFARLLASVPVRERPQIAVFYDGYNDSNHAFLFGAGAIQSDLSLKLAMLVEGRSASLLSYAASSWLAKKSRLWKIVHSLIELELFPLPPPNATEENLEKAVSVYANNVAMADSICRTFNIDCFFVLQPLVVTKQPLGPLEAEVAREIGEPATRFVQNFYQRARSRLSGLPRFIDLSHVLDDHQPDDFFDLGHTGALTAPIIGQALGQEIASRLGSTQK
jgi:hypothetical protein